MVMPSKSSLNTPSAAPRTGRTSRREELEEELAVRQQRISDRINAVQSYVPTGSGVLGSAFRRLRGRRLLPVVAAVSVFLAVRGLRSRRWTPYEEGLDHVSERLTQRIAEQIKVGEDPSDAVRAALEEHPPILELRQSRGLIGLVVHHFSHSLSSAFSRELVHQAVAWLERKRQDR